MNVELINCHCMINFLWQCIDKLMVMRIRMIYIMIYIKLYAINDAPDIENDFHKMLYRLVKRVIMADVWNWNLRILSTLSCLTVSI